MDSVTQIILGAAVGEAVLGKKLGNKAVIWGGISGTIPDLDILFSPFMSEIDSLAFHRGISHSIFFALIAGPLFGWLLFQYYNKKESAKSNSRIDYGSLREWQMLFFLGFLTHSLLDSFTMYGTQLFAPISDYRVAFNSISVADFFYTLPFLLCLVMCIFSKINSSRRIFWNYAGLIISSLYLFFTVCNKYYISSIFEEAIKENNIIKQRSIIGPTILTNFLWSITVDDGITYYNAKYSWFDSSPIKFKAIEKNHHLIKDKNDKTVETLQWFTKDFYNVMPLADDQIQINDLRFGTFDNPDESKNFIFRFVLQKQEGGQYELISSEGGPPSGDEKKTFSDLWSRIKGV